MGANVEVDIFLKKGYFSFAQLFSVLEQEGLSVEIKDMRVFDDWNYTHETRVDLKSLDLDRSDLFLKKFTLSHLVVNRTWNCVLITSFGDGYLNLSFGLDTNDLLRPGQTDYDGQVAVVYDRVADRLNETMSHPLWSELFLAASMGVEYSVRFHNNILAMLREENGVARWVFPKTVATTISGGRFLQEEKSNTVVFH